jgi:site-specific recombinase XerD
MQNPLSPDIWQQLHQGHQTLTAEQEQRFLEAAKVSEPETRALCELLYWTGCRLSEAIALRRSHIDTDRHFVVLHTLKQRDRPTLRAVPVPRKLIQRLYGLPVASDDRFWPYSRWTARRRLQPVFAAAGLSGAQATSRVFRHSYNARAIRRGLPDRVRRSLLGHKTQSANNHYGHVLGYELRTFARRLWGS